LVADVEEEEEEEEGRGVGAVRSLHAAFGHGGMHAAYARAFSDESAAKEEEDDDDDEDEDEEDEGEEEEEGEEEDEDEDEEEVAPARQSTGGGRAAEAWAREKSKDDGEMVRVEEQPSPDGADMRSQLLRAVPHTHARAQRAGARDGRRAVAALLMQQLVVTLLTGACACHACVC
jgi:hypothetical protein